MEKLHTLDHVLRFARTHLSLPLLQRLSDGGEKWRGKWREKSTQHDENGDTRTFSSLSHEPSTLLRVPFHSPLSEHEDLSQGGWCHACDSQDSAAHLSASQSLQEV